MLKTRFQGSFRGVAQHLAGFADVGDGMPYISLARVFVIRLQLTTHNLIQLFNQLIQTRLGAASNIEGFSCYVGTVRRFQVGVDYVGDESEIPRLFSISINGRRLARQQEGAKTGYNGGIMRIRILARPEDVEISQGHGFKAVELMKKPAIFFCNELAERIRRKTSSSAILLLGQVGIVAVYGGGRRGNDSLYAGIAGRCQNR